MNVCRYVDANGVMAGAAWDVARQPCTPGLIQIGTLDGAAPPNPLCLCCPNPLPQFFSLGLEAPVCVTPPGPGPVKNGFVKRSPVRGAFNSHGCVWDRLYGTSWM
jgi:hypothetical protein